MIKGNNTDISKHIVITGTNRGIGLETARYLATHGHHVLALSRNIESISTIASQFDGLIKYESVDLRDESVKLDQIVSSHLTVWTV